MNIKLFDRYFEETEESFEARINTWINKMSIEVVDIKFTSTIESEGKVMDVMIIYKV